MANKEIIYKGLKLEKNLHVEVTDEEVEKEIEALLQQRISYEEVERPSQNGDIVNIDFEGFVDGVAFEGGKAEKYDLELGSGSFIPGFEEQLLNYKKDDEVDVNVTFPEEYHAENLKGKAAIFKCKIHSVKEKKVPVLNDEFAQSNGIPTAEELKEIVKRNMFAHKQNEAQNAYISKVSAHIVENSEFEVEENALNAKLDEMLAYYADNMTQYGIGLEDYVKMMGMDMDTFKSKLTPEAMKAAKTDLLYDYIIQEEGFVVTDEEVEKEIELIKNYYGLNDEQIEEFRKEKIEDLKLDMLRQKVSRLLLTCNE